MRLPVAVAPMFLVSGPDMVQSARRAGLMASFPFPNARTIETLAEWMSLVCAPQPDLAPFAANMVTHSSYARFDAELDLVAQHKPDVVITALGGPRRVVETVHTYGGLVFADVNSVPFARKAVDQGADGLVLVASGAGGHTGPMSPFAFVSAVRRFFDGPVILGGGISDGRGIRAAEVLGADLAYMGTRFIAADDSLASADYRQMVVAAEFEDLVMSNELTGANAYYLKASLERMGVGGKGRSDGPDFSDSENQVKAWRDVWSAGHGVGSVTGIEPMDAIVAALETEYRAACATPAHAVAAQRSAAQ